MELVALDIGGTHARFALANLAPGSQPHLGETITLRTREYAGLPEAWAEFARLLGRPVPRRAAIAIAAPVTGETLRMTNAGWIIKPRELKQALGLDQVSVLNDFEAVAHAAASLPESAFDHLAGPDRPLPQSGTVTVLGPGTGLGVAYFRRHAQGGRPGVLVTATEGAHIGLAPLDEIDDLILARLRARHGRVSVERLVSGSGIIEIHAALAVHAGRAPTQIDERTLWSTGLDGSDPHAAEAVARFCRSLGSVAGDYALAHGAAAVVIAGGLGLRLRDSLAPAGFAESFAHKGRYEELMASIPVRMMTHPQPGLLGAAATFASEHGYEPAAALTA